MIFVLGSVLAGRPRRTGELIACRVVQGVGAGGLTALAQVIMATMIAPRERGRYSGYLGAVMAVGTIGGPLIGGVIVDTAWLGWRWCFYVGVPFAVARPDRAPEDPAPARGQAQGARSTGGAPP